ncbi:MAG: hypothetical protein F4Y87_00830, partial [Synechococcus sp. SB0665_bin_28]|nr:hypothetical protein [Synechococcus sp. SB0665_bin_28]
MGPGVRLAAGHLLAGLLLAGLATGAQAQTEPNIFWDRATWSTGENAGTAYLLMQSTRAVVSALSVDYSLSGTATCGTDYTITGA